MEAAADVYDDLPPLVDLNSTNRKVVQQEVNLPDNWTIGYGWTRGWAGHDPSNEMHVLILQIMQQYNLL